MQKASIYSYIHISLNLFYKVNGNADIISTVDLFYKIHKVFNIAYDKHIKQMMLFLEYFIYQVKENEKQLSLNTRRVGERIFEQ